MDIAVSLVELVM